jgi:threonine synthase
MLTIEAQIEQVTAGSGQALSTRNTEEVADFETSLIDGAAPDGGLYMPTEIPTDFFEQEILPAIKQLEKPPQIR